MISKDEQKSLNELGEFGSEKTNALLIRILRQLEEANRQLKALGEKPAKPSGR